MNAKTLRIVKLITGIILFSAGVFFIFVLISLLGDAVREEKFIITLAAMSILIAIPIGGGIILIKK